MFNVALGAGLCVAVLASLAGIAPIGTALVLFGVISWFALPGLVLAWRLYGRQQGGWLAALLSGPAWGYILSSLVLLGFWMAGLRAGVWIAAAPLVASVAAALLGRRAPDVAPPLFSRRDLAALAFVLLAVPAIAGRPYAQVGVDLPEGRAYRAYFTADFVWEMTVASELSKGAVPPQNPFHVKDPLHYYWLMYLLPGAEYRAAGGRVRLDDILLVNAFWVGLAFVAFLYFLVRHLTARPWPAALAVAFVLFCSSFEGADRLWLHWQQGIPWDAVRVINIDAVANWYYQGMKVDGLHRAILYQPQHQLGYILGLSALLLIVQARDAGRPRLLFVAGVLLAGSMLLSTVSALMLTVIAAAYEFVRLVQARRWGALIPCAVAAAVPMAGALGIIEWFEYVDSASAGNPIVRLGANELAMHRIEWSGFLNFGPVLLLALPGLAVSVIRRRWARTVPLLVLFVTCVVFYFWVDIPEHDSVYVAWRASHLAFIGFAALIGLAFEELWSLPPMARAASAACVAAIALVAVPTVLIDIYNAQDVTNRAMGPGFRWTVVLTPQELEAFEWVKRHTLPDARVQIEPHVRERDAYYITAFAERRMAGGLPTGLIPLAKYRAVSDQIRAIYRAAEAGDAAQRAQGLCVDYLLVGEPERAAYPAFAPMADAAPHLFQPAFRNDAVTVYAVGRDPAACR